MLSLAKRKFLLWVILSSLVPLIWFRPFDTLISGGDFWLPLGTKDTLISLLSSWLPNVSGGQENTIIFHAFPWVFFWSFFQSLSLSLSAIEKLWFISLYLVSGLAVYFLTFEVFSGKGESWKNFLPSIFYSFNLYILVTGTVTTTLLSYSLMPLLLLWFLKGLRAKSALAPALRLALLTVFLTSAAANPPIYLIPFFLLFLFAIYAGVFRVNKNFSWSFIFEFCLFYFLFNSWWLFLFIKGLISQLDLVRTITAAATVGAYSYYSDVIRLLGSWAFFAGHQGFPYFPYAQSYLSPVLMGLTFLVPGLVFLGSLLRPERSRRLVGFFTLLAVLGLFLSHGHGSDLVGRFYTFINKVVPFFWIYREPYAKFAALTALSYAILIGAFFGFLESQPRLTPLLNFFGVLVLVLILTVSWPLVTGDHYPPTRGVLASSRVKIPDYWFETARFFKDQEKEGRLLILPDNPNANRSGIPYAWGYDSADVGPHLLTVPWVERNNGFYGLPAASDLITRSAYRSVHDNYLSAANFFRVLPLLNVNRILQRNDIDLRRIDSHPEYYSPSYLRVFLKESREVSLEKSIGALDIYKVSSSIKSSKIYVPKEVTCLSGDVSHFDFPLDIEEPLSARAYLAAKDLGRSAPDLLAQCQSFYYLPVTVYREGDRFKSLAFNESYQFQDPKSLNYQFSFQNYRGQKSLDDSFGFDLPEEGRYQIYLLGNKTFSTDSLPSYRLFRMGEAEPEVGRGIAEKALGKNLFYDLGTYPMRSGSYLVLIDNYFSNLVKDSSFEEKGWFSSLLRREVPLSAASLERGRSLSLEPGQVDAAYYLAGLNKSLSYEITFSYKVVSGDVPHFYFWENGCDVTEPVWERFEAGSDNSCKSNFVLSKPMTPSADWTRYQGQYIPDTKAKHIGMGFVFLKDDGRVTANRGQTLIDDITVRHQYLGGLAVKRIDAVKETKTPTVQALNSSPTSYRIKVRGAEGAYTLVFSETFNPGWRAAVVKPGGRQSVPPANHFVVNGYANAWVIDVPGDYEVEIYYRPEKWFRLSLIISGLSLLIALSYLVFEKVRPRLNYEIA